MKTDWVWPQITPAEHKGIVTAWTSTLTTCRSANNIKLMYVYCTWRSVSVAAVLQESLLSNVRVKRVFNEPLSSEAAIMLLNWHSVRVTAEGWLTEKEVREWEDSVCVCVCGGSRYVEGIPKLLSKFTCRPESERRDREGILGTIFLSLTPSSGKKSQYHNLYNLKC